MEITTIALDAMSGDHGPTVVVPAAIDVLKTNSNLHIILVGDESTIKAQLVKHQAPQTKQIQIRHTSEVVAMDEPPAQALRFKKDSSMRVAINLVKQGDADACVSAGNTGALMATARFVLKTLPGIDRPAICSVMPTKENGEVRMLDLGANVDSSAEQLHQFAIMGSILTKCVSTIERPKVGLLNIGSEDIKGNEQVKETAKLLSECPELNYIGYVEGDDIYKGIVDVVVCDGFVGNVALKTSEGLAKLIKQFVKDAFNENIGSRIMGLMALPVLKKLARRLDPSRYNGASFVGLQGIVVKSHGGTNRIGFAQAIKEAILEVQQNLPEKIGAEIAAIMQARKQE